jgi:hypothetical protein
MMVRENGAPIGLNCPSFFPTTLTSEKPSFRKICSNARLFGSHHEMLSST